MCIFRRVVFAGSGGSTLVVVSSGAYCMMCAAFVPVVLVAFLYRKKVHDESFSRQFSR